MLSRRVVDLWMIEPATPQVWDSADLDDTTSSPVAATCCGTTGRRPSCCINNSSCRHNELAGGSELLCFDPAFVSTADTTCTPRQRAPLLRPSLGPAPPTPSPSAKHLTERRCGDPRWSMPLWRPCSWSTPVRTGAGGGMRVRARVDAGRLLPIELRWTPATPALPISSIPAPWRRCMEKMTTGPDFPPSPGHKLASAGTSSSATL
jgi:hypothetical protein